MCRTARFLPRRRTKCLDRNVQSFCRVDERKRCGSQPANRPPRRGVLVNAGTAFLLAFVILATGALVVASQPMADPLAQFRTPDGGLQIPGRALTPELQRLLFQDRKSTRLNSSHHVISYAVFCLKK